MSESRAFSGPCLVTGGAGFAGRSLVRRLIEGGFAVRVLDLARHPGLDPRAEFLCGDIRSADDVRDAVRGIETVFHCAVQMVFLKTAKPDIRQRAFDINVGGTEQLLLACQEANVKQFIYLSSNNVALSGNIEDGDEKLDYAKEPLDIYSATKIKAEQLVLAAGKQGKLKTCALRPGGIWGPAEGSLVIDNIIRSLAKNEFVARPGSNAPSDNTHVDNLVDALLLAAAALVADAAHVSGEAFFVTDGEPVDPIEWYRPLVEGLGHKMPERRIPSALLYAIGALQEWRYYFGGPAPNLTRSLVQKTSLTHIFRSDKAKRLLGYEPKVTRQNGIAACIEFARGKLLAMKAG